MKGATPQEKSFALGLVSKEEFFKKANDRKTPYDQIEGLRRTYLQQNLVNIREDFIKKAKDKKVEDDKIEELWKKYLSYL